MPIHNNIKYTNKEIISITINRNFKILEMLIMGQTYTYVDWVIIVECEMYTPIK